MIKINSRNMFFRLFWRLGLIFLATIPVVYWQQFYQHFYVYLTGTVINEVITNKWQLVIFFIILFSIFFIPFRFRQRVQWINYGLVTAFFISLFVEMYGLPLTIMFAAKYFFTPGAVLPANFLEFYFLGVGIGMDLAMIYGAILMIIGMILIISGWYSLYKQTKHGNIAERGLYRISRHPQYTGFILIISGWFFGWPTILTLIFCPIFIFKYIRAAKKEEKEMSIWFEEYPAYLRETPFLF